jgi:hypothetical protein
MSDRTILLKKTEEFQVPTIVGDLGPDATKRFFAFFTVPIRNKKYPGSLLPLPFARENRRRSHGMGVVVDLESSTTNRSCRLQNVLISSGVKTTNSKPSWVSCVYVDVQQTDNYT